MRLCFTRICMVLFLPVPLVFSEVTIENGGYNVLVTFSQNVDPDEGLALIESMQTSFKEASEFLYNAIGLQFSKVTLKIPEYWDLSGYEVGDFEESFTSDSIKADILIDSTEDTVFGKFPYTQQYGSCNVPGHQIIIPTDFFDDERNRFPKGISLAREWLKYRYGVFDENGYLDDPLYPMYYNIPGSDANEVHVTDCAESKITYNFVDQQGEGCPNDEKLIDKLKSQQCKVDISDETLENVTSSFMYFHESIISMTHICDDNHQHNSRSPNKQNVLCNGKSIGDVMSVSSDLKNKPEEKEHSDIQFVFSKKLQPRVVVAWENTKQLENKGQIILNAITKLMIDLPDGSKFNAFPFPLKANVPTDYYTLKHLDGVNTRKAIASEIKSDFVKVENGNYKDSVVKAIEVLKSAAVNFTEPPGSIIIITGTAEDLIVVLVKDVNACMKSFDSLPDNISFILPDLPCLEVEPIPKSEEPEATYKKLIQTIQKVSPSKLQDKLIELLKVEYLKEDTTLNVEVDNFTETVAFSIFGDKEAESFKLELDGEIKTEIEEESYKNVLKLSYSPEQAGTIAFSFAYPTPEPVLVEVKKTSKPGKYISGEVLVHDTTKEEDPDQMPVIIYAIVRFGSYPVQNAKVSAIIERPDGKKDLLHPLNDDGIGDPDITQNDGIYSRYYTRFSGAGDYTVKVLVKNNNSVTRYGADKTAGYKSCCGSVVSADGSHKNGDTPDLGEFVKIFETTFTTKSGRPVDGYKPSRVTDLRIDSVTDDGIVLKWTAPGEEADSGIVHSYEIKSFTSPEEATNNFDNGTDLFNYTFPTKAKGETEKLKINFGAFKGSGLHYIAMAAKNLKKKSDPSTIIEVYVSNDETTDSPDINKKDEAKTSKTSPKTIGLIVGLIVGLILLMIIIYLAIYFVIVKPKRKNKQKENPIYEPSKRNDTNALNPINSVSADILIKHHNEKVKAKTQNKQPPIFKEEDFVDRNLQPTNETSASSNDQEQESSHKNVGNGQPYPPKSPKRITRV